ncbi:MAG TPA: hypothetical protein PKZ40_04760, partial [Anaerolineaceae bacterium]|nr:hypothetical protein [Anaerolineaceae bacterium]
LATATCSRHATRRGHLWQWINWDSKACNAEALLWGLIGSTTAIIANELEVIENTKAATRK